MKTHRILGVLLAGGLAVAATAPVAMRVEVEPLRPVGSNTEVAVIIGVAPMDRDRIGSNAIVRIELDEGRVSSGSPMRAVQAGDDGSFRVVIEWPPGEHDLRVEIEDPNREDTGLWVGTVRIPDLSGSDVTAESEEPVPVPVPVPDSSQRSPEAKPEPEPKVADQPAAAPELEKPEPPTAEQEVAIDETALDVPAAAAATAVAAVTPEAPAPAAPAEPEVTRLGEPEEPEGVPEPEPEAAVTTVDDEPEPAPVPEPEPETAEPALAEPLRAEPPPETAVPEAAEPGVPPAQASAAAPVSADVAARYAEWERADSEVREFSVIAMRGRDPAQDLDAGDLRLRVGGSEMPVEKLGDADSAPLLLGLAIDVVSDEVDGWSGTQGSLAPIAERAGGGRGRVFVATSSEVGDWKAEAGPSEGGVASQPTMNVARLVVASLERFEGERGRTFLLVLTDGRSEPAKDEWQRANDAAGAAGVPILVVALWDDDFSQRTRKNLKKLTVLSGGSLFLVQGRTQLDSAADRFGRYLDGGYAVRFRMLSAERGTAMAVSVSATDREITISAPKSIR